MLLSVFRDETTPKQFSSGKDALARCRASSVCLNVGHVIQSGIQV